MCDEILQHTWMGRTRRELAWGGGGQHKFYSITINATGWCINTLCTCGPFVHRVLIVCCMCLCLQRDPRAAKWNCIFELLSHARAHSCIHLVTRSSFHVLHHHFSFLPDSAQWKFHLATSFFYTSNRIHFVITYNGESQPTAFAPVGDDGGRIQRTLSFSYRRSKVTGELPHHVKRGRWRERCG